MDEKSQKKSIYWLHAAIVVLFMFCFRFLPAPAPITTYGMQILGIFLGLVWGWSFCDLAWPSLLGMAALGVTDYGMTSAVFEASFGQANLIVILLSFLMFAPLTQSGLSEWLGMKLVSIKFMRGKPLVMIGVIYIGTFILCIFVNALVVGIFMMQLFVDMFKKLGYQKGDRFIPMFLAGMFMCTGLANLLLPFKGMPLMIFGTAASSGIVVDTNQYLIFAIASIVFLIVWYLLMIKVLRCNIEPLRNADFTEYEEKLQEPLTPFQRALLKIVVLFVVGIVFVGVLGSAKGGAFAQLLNNIGIYGVAAITLALMIVIRIQGEPLLDLRKAAAGMQWDFIFLYAMAMVISSLLTDAETGIAGFIIRYVTPIMSGLGSYWFLLFLALVTLLLTNIGNNVVVIFTMASVVTMMAGQGMPINGPLAICIVLWTGLVTGYLLPAASVSAAMIFGCELTTSKSSIMQGVIMMTLWLIALAVFMIPIGLVLL